MTDRGLAFLALVALAVAIVAQRAVSSWRTSQLARALEAETDVGKLESSLAHPSPLVREAAAKRLGGLLKPEEIAARADRLVALAADPVADGLARLNAQDALELVPAPREHVAAVARRALEAATAPTVELLTVVAFWGEPGDAALAARFLAAEDFPVASAAATAVEELVARGAPPDPAPLNAALAMAREKLRGVHPPGDNPLADELVERIEALEGARP